MMDDDSADLLFVASRDVGDLFNLANSNYAGVRNMCNPI
jgi:hypothetical protein